MRKGTRHVMLLAATRISAALASLRRRVSGVNECALARATYSMRSSVVNSSWGTKGAAEAASAFPTLARDASGDASAASSDPWCASHGMLAGKVWWRCVNGPSRDNWCVRVGDGPSAARKRQRNSPRVFDLLLRVCSCLQSCVKATVLCYRWVGEQVSCAKVSALKGNAPHEFQLLGPPTHTAMYCSTWPPRCKCDVASNSAHVDTGRSDKTRRAARVGLGI